MAVSLIGMADLEYPLVCCAPRQTYGTGAIPQDLIDPAGATTLARDPKDHGIYQEHELFATARYRWRISDDMFVKEDAFTQHLRGFYQSISVKDCPASWLVRLERAILARNILYCTVGGAISVVYETYRPNDRAAVTLVDEEALHQAERTRFADPEWRNLYVGSAGSFNYGHWLVDDLPRIIAVLHMEHHDPRPIRVLIHSYGNYIDRIKIESIRTLLNIKIHIDLLDPASIYYFDTLYYPTPSTFHPVLKSPLAIDFSARKIVEHALSDVNLEGHAERIFVDRASAHGRTISNRQEMRQEMDRRGFSIIDPETMSFVEQVRAFANASVVIGQMGAAMTNTIFCRPTSTLIYLAPRGWIEPFYWDLASVRGHHYRVLYGDVIDPNVAPHQSNFTIDVAALSQVIEAL